jgi:hypothetical protein
MKMTARQITKFFKCEVWTLKERNVICSGYMIYCPELKAANWGDGYFYDISGFKKSRYWQKVCDL